MRKRHRAKLDRAVPHGEGVFGPGDLVREYGRRSKWPLSTRNIMVEGTLDVKYFELADKLYKKEHNKSLLDHQLSLFAVGERERGGTNNIRIKFLTLRDVLIADPVDRNGEKILAVCLVDNDLAGRGLCKVLQGAGFVLHKDMFLLNRKFPCSTRAPHEFAVLLARENSKWSHLDCVIEDLMDRELLNLFVEQEPHSLKSEPIICNDAYHYNFEMHVKPSLFRYVRDYAIITDIQNIISVLQAMRFALGLDPCGTPVGANTG